LPIMDPTSCRVDLATGAMSGQTGSYQKRLIDLAGLYADGAAFAALAGREADAVVYSVQEFRPSSLGSDLVFGVTHMRPGRIGSEYFMTRGHIHLPADRPELYFGLAGRGVMQLESPGGETRVVEMAPQVACYVPPHWIHRSVNTGAADLVMLFSYPADSGQDYQIIERAHGMRHRVFATGAGGWQLVENPDYRPRAGAPPALPPAVAGNLETPGDPNDK